MRCSYCKGNIGFWRGLSDREFCSDDHRRRGRSVNARQARESLIYGDEELYAVVAGDRKKQEKQAKLQAQIIVVLSTVMIGVLAFSAATGGGSPQTLGQKTISLTGDLAKSNPFVERARDYLKTVIPIEAPVKLHEDFRSGTAAWIGGAKDWRFEDGIIRPASLRVWKPSLKLADYRLEFEGQIEKNAMSWAFRAPDIRNYYATKIQIRKSGQLPVADLIRYTVVNGTERDRQRLPLPMSIRPEMLYHVQLSVRGNNFVTKVNGQVVDSWTDARHKKGGVGFFADRGESSSIHWVDVREEADSLIGRLLALGFFVSPLAYYE